MAALDFDKVDNKNWEDRHSPYYIYELSWPFEKPLGAIDASA